MDFSATRIAGLEAELAALRGTGPASAGGGTAGAASATASTNALTEALQVPRSGQVVADNYLQPSNFVASCAHFGRHHPRGGNTYRGAPHELSSHELAQTSAAYQQALSTNKNEEARVLLTVLLGALYLEVGALGLADCLGARDKLLDSARATTASVTSALPEGEDADEEGLSEEERAQRRAHLKVRAGIIETLEASERDLEDFFRGLAHVGNTIGGSFALVRRAAELQEWVLAPSWQVSAEERRYHRATARVANSFAVTDPGLVQEREQYKLAHAQGYLRGVANSIARRGNGDHEDKKNPRKPKPPKGKKPDKADGDKPQPEKKQ